MLLPPSLSSTPLMPTRLALSAPSVAAPPTLTLLSSPRSPSPPPAGPFFLAPPPAGTLRIAMSSVYLQDSRVSGVGLLLSMSIFNPSLSPGRNRRNRARLLCPLDRPGSQKARVYPRDRAASIRGNPATRSHANPEPRAGGRSCAFPTQKWQRASSLRSAAGMVSQRDAALGSEPRARRAGRRAERNQQRAAG